MGGYKSKVPQSQEVDGVNDLDLDVELNLQQQLMANMGGENRPGFNQNIRIQGGEFFDDLNTAIKTNQ